MADRPNSMNVDIDAIRHNVRTLEGRYGDGVTFVASLKANAYGFGLRGVAPVVVAAGAKMLAVASVDDAIELRSMGIRVPILLYGGTRPSPSVVAEVVEHDITVSILDGADVAAYGAARGPVTGLVKVDVGLERLGAEPDGAVELARLAHRHPGIILGGLYTHLHVPRGEVAPVVRYVEWQYERFAGAVARIEAEGIPVPIRMAASSGALRLSDAMAMNAIDVGSLLYALEPPGPSDRDLGLRPALVSITSTLSQVRPRVRTDFPEFSPIPTGRPVLLGVIPFGTTDGFLALSTGQVLVRGRRATVLSISLEHARLDLTGIDAQAGDEVVIVGHQGDAEITMRDVAAANHLYSPAVVPAVVGRGVPRTYRGSTS